MHILLPRLTVFISALDINNNRLVIIVVVVLAFLTWTGHILRCLCVEGQIRHVEDGAVLEKPTDCN